MKRFLPLVLFGLFVLSAHAQRITMTVTITNRAVTSNSFTVNGVVRVFTNVQTALTIETNLTSVNATKTNLLRQLGTYPPAGITLTDGSGPADSGTNSFRLFSSFGGALSGSITGNWGSMTLSTQAGPSTFTMLYPMVNVTGDTNKTNQASDIVTSINSYNTNSFATNAAALSNFITKGASPLQKIASPKQFEGTLISASNLLATNGYTVSMTNINEVSSNSINYGSAFRSPGSGANSLQLGSNALATGVRAVAMGTMSVAAGEDGVAIGTGATNMTNFGTVVGNLAFGNGQGATAIGYNTIASNIGTAVGAVALAGTNATALGAGATAVGLTAVAVGDTASANAYAAIAVGASSTASKVHAMALGQAAQATHSNSVAFGPLAHDGTGVATTTTNQVRIGTGAHVVSIPGFVQGVFSNFVTAVNQTNIARGSWAYPRADLTSIANGNNIAVPLGTNRFVRLAGTVTASPTLCGFVGAATTGGNDGQEVVIHNDLGFAATIAQNTVDPVPANRVETVSGTDVTLAANGWAVLQYSSADARWHVAQTYPSTSVATNAVTSIYTNGTPVSSAATVLDVIGGTNISVLSTNTAGIVTLALNVPTDFTNVYHVNPDSNLSSILTNAPNNSTIQIGQGFWTNAVSRQFSNNVLGMFHLRNKTNITINGFGRATLVTTNEGDHLVLTNCSNIKIFGLNFKGVKQTNNTQLSLYGALIIAASREVEIANCDFSEIGDHAIIDHIGLTGGFQSTNVYIHDNRFFWVGGWSDNTLGYDGAGVVLGSHWRVWRNRFIECSQPIEFFGSFEAREVVHCHVDDNYLENPVKFGMSDNGQTNNYWQRITRNFILFDDSKRTVTSNGLAAADAINIGTGRGMLIEGNTIMGAPQAAINYIANSDTWPSWGNRIAGNTFSNNQFDVVISTGQKRNFRVVGNRSFRSRLPYYIGGSNHVIEDNDIEDAVSGGQETAIRVGFMGFLPATNVQVLNNRITANVGYTPGGSGILFYNDAVNCRQFGNQISSSYSPKIIDNGVTPQPNFWIDMVPGISTNPFVIYNTNTAPVFSVDSRGFLLITNSLTNRVAAPTNNIAIGADSFGGMNLPNWTDHNGLQSALQPFLGHEQVYWLGTGAGAVGNDEGVLSVTNGGAVVSHPAPVESQMFMQQLDTPASSNGCATRFSSVDLANAGAHNGSSKIGGYFYVATWCSTNLIAQVEGGGAPRTFVGMTTLATEAYTNMVVTTNATAQYVGLMVDSKQSTNMFLTARDASAEFRTNTGLPFIATNVYKFYLFNAPTSRFVNWRLDDAYTGASRSGWFSNNVPTNFMKFGIATKNGTNRAHSVRYSRIYLQAPLAPPR